MQSRPPATFLCYTFASHTKGCEEDEYPLKRRRREREPVQARPYAREEWTSELQGERSSQGLDASILSRSCHRYQGKGYKQTVPRTVKPYPIGSEAGFFLPVASPAGFLFTKRKSYGVAQDLSGVLRCLTLHGTSHQFDG